MPFVIALTGGIASGKSAVSSICVSNDIPIVDCDYITRQVQMPGTPCAQRIFQTWPSTRNSDGTINREALGTIIFSDARERQRLNSLMRPYLFSAIVKATFKACWTARTPFVILDIPLLYESGIFRRIAAVEVVVSAPDDVRVARLVRRDQSLRGDGPDAVAAATARLASQMPLATKVGLCDIVIDNSGNHAELAKNVKKALRDCQSFAGKSFLRRARATVSLWVYAAVAWLVGAWLCWRDRKLGALDAS